MVLESSDQPELCLIGLAPGPGATLLWTDIQIDRFIFVFQSLRVEEREANLSPRSVKLHENLSDDLLGNTSIFQS